MFFPHLGCAWGFGGTLRRRLKKIAYRALPKRPQSDLCGERGSYLLDKRR